MNHSGVEGERGDERPLHSFDELFRKENLLDNQTNAIVSTKY